MSDKATTTTPDPELYLPKTTEDGLPLEGENPRGEVAGCPTGLSELAEPQRQGDAGVTGVVKKEEKKE